METQAKGSVAWSPAISAAVFDGLGMTQEQVVKRVQMCVDLAERVVYQLGPVSTGPSAKQSPGPK